MELLTGSPARGPPQSSPGPCGRVQPPLSPAQRPGWTYSATASLQTPGRPVAEGQLIQALVKSLCENGGVASPHRWLFVLADTCHLLVCLNDAGGAGLPICCRPSRPQLPPDPGPGRSPACRPSQCRGRLGPLSLSPVPQGWCLVPGRAGAG